MICTLIFGITFTVAWSYGPTYECDIDFEFDIIS